MFVNLMIPGSCEIIGDTDSMTREEWLALRAEGLGGSDSPGILGASPWASKLSVWVDKTNRGVPKQENHRMNLGRIIEHGVVKILPELVAGAKAHPFHKVLRSVHIPIFQANLDGIAEVAGRFGVLEVKSILKESEWESAPPLYYQIQGQHYLYVTGLPFVLFIGVSAWNIFPYLIERDEAMIRAIVDEGRVFWNAHVIPDIAPAPSGIEAEDEYLNANLGDDDSEVFIDEAMVAQYKRFKYEASEAEKSAKALMSTLKAALGTSSVGLAGKYRLFVQKSERAGYSVPPSTITTVRIVEEKKR